MKRLSMLSTVQGKRKSKASKVKEKIKAGFKKTKKQLEACWLLGSKGCLYVLLYGGSRSGKTFIIVRAIFLRAIKYPGSRHLIVRLRFQHAKQSLWYDTIPKVIRLCFPDCKLGSGKNVDIKENKQDWFYTLWNGSQVWIGGLDDKDRVEKILGNEYATIYFNEASQLSYNSVKVAVTRLAQNVQGCAKKFYIDCNPPNKRHWLYTLFIKKIDPSTGLPLAKPSKYAHMMMNPIDNVSILGKDYIEDVLGSLSEREKKRFRDGEWLDDAEGSLFKYSDFAKARIDPDNFDFRTLDSIVVAVDPAMSNTANSDEHGIVVIGYKNSTEDLYVLEDASLVGSPRTWALKVVGLFDNWEANEVIGEVNNGGDLVEVNLRTVSVSIPYTPVHASRGKAIRAEPVASMCERGKLHLVGDFPQLEEECTSWVPDSGMKSPNRMDAMVWGCTKFIKNRKSAGSWR